ncbi:MAG: tetratricopeptide repeat protein [Ignavibacteria bacterium]|jgi:TolA-binding protein|nr:tetratricopeptide repeat protein [Ignavibacteria bacterium]MCU7502817.1 tetratricopeptide repeat protein [Ignavibacteria bacterium]MCU7517903.1 tetratricopeptide repeat protein [Ignavibacteria bacterium]
MHTIKRLLTRKLVVIAILLIPAVFTGCGLWNNFTAYFNVYYNAAKSFQEAEQSIIDQKKNIFTSAEQRPAGTTNEILNKVIEKLSKLLQFNSESDLVDDALLMIGKSFYYQQDYQKALRKFTELISTFPKSDLVLETQLWIGKTQLRLKNYEQAASTLEEVQKAAKESDDNEIMTQAYVEQITYLLAQEKYDDALTSLQQLVKVSDNDKINAAAMYEMGRTYLKLNKPEDAARAFAGVLDYSPTYDMEYLSKLQYGRVQRELGNPERSLNIFDNIIDDSKYDPYKDSTEIQIGLTYLQMKRYDDAFSQFARVDTVFKQSPNSGIAQYYEGEILELQHADYDSANFYYKKAMSSAAPQEFTQKASRKVQNYTKYDNLTNALKQYNRQLAYIMDPQLYLQDSIAYYKEQALQDSLAKEKAKLTNQQFKEDNPNSRNSSRREDPTKTQQTVQTKKATPPKMPKISADSVKTILAKSEYELGGLFFTELNVSDSAYYYYKHVVDAYPGNPYMGRALYALASYYLTKDNKAKADSLFEVIYRDYNNESIVNAAAAKLGKPLINLKYDEAEELFVHAEKKMQDSLYKEAISEFGSIYHRYPKSSFAPKALYASGWIYENNLDMPDSAAAIYDSVVMKFPSSKYASAVKGKLQIFKEEKKKEQAVRDSINAAKNKLNNPESQQQQLNQGAGIADSLSNSPNGNNANVNQGGTQQQNQNLQNQHKGGNQNLLPGNTQNKSGMNAPGTGQTAADSLKNRTVPVDSLKGKTGPGQLNNNGTPVDTLKQNIQPKDSTKVNDTKKKAPVIEK